MQLNIDEFSQFLGLGREAVPASQAIGVLTARPVQAVRTAPIDIPQGSVFNTESLIFESLALASLSESATFVPITAQCKTPGIIGNIAAGQTWSSNVAGLTISNESAFAGGAEAVPERLGIYPQRQRGLGPTPESLQRALDVGQAVIKQMLDVETLPDDPRVRESVFLISMYRLENTGSQEVTFQKPSQHATSPTERRWFRSAVYAPLMGQVGRLLAHIRPYSKLINGPQTA